MLERIAVTLLGYIDRLDITNNWAYTMGSILSCQSSFGEGLVFFNYDFKNKYPEHFLYISLTNG